MKLFKTRISHLQPAPHHTCTAAKSRSALDVATATSPSAQDFSLAQEQSGIDLKVRNACISRQSGSILIAIIIMMPFFMAIAMAYLQLATTGYKIARKDQFHTHAQLAADAGIDASLEIINQNDTWSGTGSELPLHNDGNIRTTYETVVTSPDADNKTIVATGRTYHPASDLTSPPDSSVSVNIKLRPVRSGNFSIVTGVGGLYLSNSAKVLGGDVFVNGELVMTGSSQVGLTTKPVTLKVAHQNCPAGANPGPTYPRVCGLGENGEPISVSNPAWIYGDVSANNQVSSSRMSLNGLVASSGVAAQALPPHDRSAQKAAVPPPPDTAHNLSGAAASCTTNGGSKTWLANTKITGNVEIDKDCTVTIEGDTWITGNFTMSHSKAKLRVSDTAGSTRPSLMIDGPSTVLRNGSSIVSNASSTGIQLITYYSSVACSVATDCLVSGTDLYNSRGLPTITLSQSSNGPNTIFYARWTKVLIENSGEIGALVGQTVELQNSGTISFGASVGTPTTFWVIDAYRRTFN